MDLKELNHHAAAVKKADDVGIIDSWGKDMHLARDVFLNIVLSNNIEVERQPSGGNKFYLYFYFNGFQYYTYLSSEEYLEKFKVHKKMTS